MLLYFFFPYQTDFQSLIYICIVSCIGAPPLSVIKCLERIRHWNTSRMLWLAKWLLLFLFSENLFFFCIPGDIWICLFERTSRVHSCGWSQSSCPSMQWAFFVFLTLSVCYIPGFAVSRSDIPNSLSSKISFYVPWDTWWQSAFHNYLTYQVVQKAKLTL